jgi:hypothetical protein
MPCTLPVSIKTVTIEGGRDQTVCYPQVVMLPDRRFERRMNRSIVRETQKLINEHGGDSPSTIQGMLGWYELKNNQREVLSLSLANNAYHYHAAHPMTFMKSLTFDLKQQKQCELKDLFKPGSDYVKKLSELIKVQIKLRDIQLISDFTAIRPDQDFYIADKTLVIYFALYEITPYVFGFPMFPISVFDLQDIIDENSALGRMAYND